MEEREIKLRRKRLGENQYCYLNTNRNSTLNQSRDLSTAMRVIRCRFCICSSPRPGTHPAHCNAFARLHVLVTRGSAAATVAMTTELRQATVIVKFCTVWCKKFWIVGMCVKSRNSYSFELSINEVFRKKDGKIVHMVNDCSFPNFEPYNRLHTFSFKQFSTCVTNAQNYVFQVSG